MKGLATEPGEVPRALQAGWEPSYTPWDPMITGSQLQTRRRGLKGQMLSYKFFPTHPFQTIYWNICKQRKKKKKDHKQGWGIRRSISTMSVTMCLLRGDHSWESKHMSHRDSFHVMAGWTAMYGAEMQLPSTYRHTGSVSPGRPRLPPCVLEGNQVPIWSCLSFCPLTCTLQKTDMLL